VEELYFDLMQETIPDDIRRKHLAYISYRLKNFALSDQEFEDIKANYFNYDKMGQLVPSFIRQVAEYTTRLLNRVDTDISRIQAKTNDFLGNIAPLRRATANPMDEAQ
jgi:hypothetical protein